MYFPDDVFDIKFTSFSGDAQVCGKIDDFIKIKKQQINTGIL